jgi:integrase
VKSQEGYLTTKSGKWLGHFSRWVIDPATGEKRRQQRAFVIGAVKSMTKTKARERLRERMVEECGLTQDSKVTFKWFAEHRWKPLWESRWRASTKTTNEQQLQVIYKRFGTTPVEDMDAVHMQAWLDTLARERSGSVVKHCRIFLLSICREAMEQDYIRKNPARLLRVPAKLRAVAKDCLTHEQIAALLKVATRVVDGFDALVLKLLLTTGMRPSELFALKWKCFNEDMSALTLSETVYRGRLRPFTKTTEEGATENVTVLITEKLSIQLAEWCYNSDFNKPDDFIFATSVGTFWLKENWQRRVLTPMAQAAGIEKCNYQTLRRTTATHSLRFGSVKDVSTILRHKSTETAQRVYIQKIDSSVRAAVENLAASILG